VTEPVWGRRFAGSTRGRIVALLRRGTRTVDGLARALDLTDNAVRAHLAALERDGLVRQQGTVRGVRKPSLAYELAPEVEPALSRAYLPLVEALVEVLAARLPPAELRAVLREAGRRVAATLPPPRGDPAARVAAAARTLDALGGAARVEPRPRGWTIASEGCPVGALVCRRAEVCLAVEAMLAALVDLAVRQACDRTGERPKCRFELDRRRASRPRSGTSRGGPGGTRA